MVIMRFPQDSRVEVGVDESGRGSIISVVVAGAVIMPPYEHLVNEHDKRMYMSITDSKKLSKTARSTLEEFIKRVARAWAVGVVDAQEIDEINILNATYKAMHYALNGIADKTQFNLILVDGNRFLRYKDVPHECIVKGDANVLSIAAASILAKTEHDRIIEALVASNPDLYNHYGLLKNMGYGTAQHIQAIKKHGLTEQHRKSFVIKALIGN